MSDSGIPFLLLQTIAIAVLGTIIGAILAIPVSFLASTNIVPSLCYVLPRTHPVDSHNPCTYLGTCMDS